MGGGGKGVQSFLIDSKVLSLFLCQPLGIIIILLPGVTQVPSLWMKAELTQGKMAEMKFWEILLGLLPPLQINERQREEKRRLLMISQRQRTTESLIPAVCVWVSCWNMELRMVSWLAGNGI